jgi:uncharacterized protein
VSVANLDWLLNGFTDRVAGVNHTIVVSGDGVLVASSRELSAERADQLAAIVAALVSLAHNISKVLGSGAVQRTIVQMRNNLLFVTAIGEGDTLASIAALATPGCDVGQVAFELSSLVEQAGAALSPATRTAT